MSASRPVHFARCPCCNNPWSAPDAQFCGVCQDTTAATAQPVEQGAGLSRSNMDLSVDPSTNFYYYANGGWIKHNPIPAEYPAWNTFLALHVASQERCKELLDALEKSYETENERKLSSFYRAAMDEEKIEQLGTTPLRPALELVEKIVQALNDNNKTEYAQLLGSLAKDYGIYPFFNTGPSPDYKNADHTMCNLSQGGLGLPDRDYYFDEDKQDKRDAYKKHIAFMLTLLENPTATEPTEECLDSAKQIYELELRLAEAHMTRTENRDPDATYNKTTVADLTGAAASVVATEESQPGEVLDFASYLKGSIGKTEEELGDINVRNVTALHRAARVAVTTDSQTIRSYLKWYTVSSCAQYLSKVFVQEDFNFFEKTLSGTQEIKPRWKRAMAFTESALGEALGELYCRRYFDEECKTRALKIVESVRQALEDRLKEVEWMTSDSTREEALKKMSRFRVKIGYPNKWIDYTTLDISDKDDFMSMVFKARAFSHARESKEMNAPTDREKWFMTPQTVNAYYHPSLNEIVFPAAILQPPFFCKDADDGVNFGSMGAVVGHEMTHAFDDKGRKFNFAGELHDWWTPDDAAEYEKRVQVMVEQANQFQVHDKPVQGKLTSGENIADLGGVRLALRALQAQPGFEPAVEIDGFTLVQRFFLAWAQCWRQNITQERSLQLLTLDPHGPNEMRCNGTLKNIPEFHAAFQIPAESPMFLDKALRVDIW